MVSFLHWRARRQLLTHAIHVNDRDRHSVLCCDTMSVPACTHPLLIWWGTYYRCFHYKHGCPCRRPSKWGFSPTWSHDTHQMTMQNEIKLLFITWVKVDTYIRKSLWFMIFILLLRRIQQVLHSCCSTRILLHIRKSFTSGGAESRVGFVESSLTNKHSFCLALVED